MLVELRCVLPNELLWISFCLGHLFRSVLAKVRATAECMQRTEDNALTTNFYVVCLRFAFCESEERRERGEGSAYIFTPEKGVLFAVIAKKKAKLQNEIKLACLPFS